MRQIQFFVAMEPVAQGRPKFSTASGFAKAYDPKKSRDAKSYVKLAAADALGIDPPLEGPLVLKITVHRPIPKSSSQRKIREMLSGLIMPITKPDVSNYQKLVEDALNGIVWRDDSQIIDGRCLKKFSLKPGFEVIVSEYLPEMGDREEIYRGRD